MSGVLASMSKAVDDVSDFDMIQLDAQFHDKLYAPRTTNGCGARGAPSAPR